MKKQVVEELRKGGMTVADAERQFDTVTAAIVQTIRSQGGARIPGLGNFTVKNQGPRTGRNPRTGEAMTIAARDVVKFKPAKDII